MKPRDIYNLELRIDNGGLETMCTWCCVFSDILAMYQSTGQSGHNIYQIKAECLSYRMVPVILLLIKEPKIYVLKITKFDLFFHHFFKRG